VRVLIVGLGSMGQRRVRNLLHIGGHEVAGVEPRHERREQASAKHGIATFAAFEDGLAWRPDALVISTPPDRHQDYALAAAREGLHFFTEATVIPGETRALIEAVGAQPIVAAPSCTLRFHPGIQLMRRRISEGAVGQPLTVVHQVGQHLADWHPWEDYRGLYAARRETGAVREIVTFELNWMTYLFGRILSVQGVCRKLSNLDVEIDDMYAALVRFDSGVQGALVVDAFSRPGVRYARLTGDEGTLVWDFAARCVREWSQREMGWIEHPDPPAVPGAGGKWVADNMYVDEMRCYLHAIASGSEHFPFSLEDAEHLMEALVALERSSVDGHCVE
jgi:predicted dehydrogenase